MSVITFNILLNEQEYNCGFQHLKLQIINSKGIYIWFAIKTENLHFLTMVFGFSVA